MSAEFKGISGNTAADLREVALTWDESAKYCESCGQIGLSFRDRRFAAAMWEAANIIEAKDSA